MKTTLEGGVSQQPSEQSSTAQQQAEPAAVAPGGSADPAATAAAEAAALASGEDWRSRKANGDTKRLEVLSRYKTEGDYDNAFFEQLKTISKRAEPTRLAENATPEQIAEWRKGLGLKDVANDAKPDAYMDAYGIKIPDGYEASDAEKGMLGDFAKRQYARGADPAMVRDAVDFFFQEQQASKQAMNQTAVERQREWQSELRTELGRDYDATIAACESYLDQAFADTPEMKHQILRAQLPGGGYLGDHPWFARLVADQALKEGFTDRIEANSMESGGKSLADQQSEIMALMATDPAKYARPDTQARLDKILGLRVKLGELDENGNEIPQRRRA